MTSATLSVPNAIVFVLDPANRRVAVPAYAPGSVTASTSSCISVATLAEVDGEVTLHLSKRTAKGSKRSGLIQVFDGVIETPNQKLAIVTSHMETILEADVAGTVSRVTISVDDADSPRVIHVVWRE